MGENKEQTAASTADPADAAIAVEKVCKVYKLYDKPKDRMFEALGLTKKKKYTEHFALSDVSFDVKQGECVGIIGTNVPSLATISVKMSGGLRATLRNIQ